MSSRRAQTREKLLQAALRRLRKGASMRLEDVATDAKVTRQTVYLHFGSRGGMLTALARFVDDEQGLAARVAQVEAVEDPGEQLEAALTVMAEYEPAIHDVAMALLLQGQSDPAAREAYDDRMADRRQGLGAVIARLAGARLLAPGWSAEEVTDALCAISSPSSYEALVVERGWPVARFRDWLVASAQMFLRADAEAN